MGPYCKLRKFNVSMLLWTHQTYVVYSIDTSNFGCLQHKSTKLMFFTVRTNQTCDVLTSVLIAEKTLPGTFVKIHITNLKPFKSSDLYGVVYKVIKIKFSIPPYNFIARGIKIVERGKINIYSTQIHDLYIS
jgi:hypothetical protein